MLLPWVNTSMHACIYVRIYYICIYNFENEQQFCDMMQTKNRFQITSRKYFLVSIVFMIVYILYNMLHTCRYICILLYLIEIKNTCIDKLLFSIFPQFKTLFSTIQYSATCDCNNEISIHILFNYSTIYELSISIIDNVKLFLCYW